MEIKQGYAYHIKDEYFTTAKDEHLMKNKEEAERACKILEKRFSL